MTAITAAMVKELRERTGAGMMDAKKALTENNGDTEAAMDWLRAKGLAKAAKKSGRTAAEGLVAVATNEAGTTASVVEVNSETDFVSRNEQFQELVKGIANVAVSNEMNDAEALNTADYGNGKSVADTVTDAIATIGEHMSVRRCASLSVDQGYVASYMHGALAPNLGKIGVLVALEGSADQSTLAELGKKIAMHVAATNPAFLSQDDVTEEAIEREKNVLREQAKESGKPADIIEKMIEGRMGKFYKEICLLEQQFVMDPDLTVKALIEKEAAGATLKAFVRYELGEGIEKEETDFAAEVAAAANG